jgi:phosphoribosylglycinamide formyltransferase-1
MNRYTLGYVSAHRRQPWRIARRIALQAPLFCARVDPSARLGYITAACRCSNLRSLVPLRLSVLISGRGTNLTAIQRAIDEGRCDAQIASVISDRASAQGLVFAAERGIRSAVVKLRDYPTRDAWDEALTQRVAESEPQLVVTAGFMRLVGPVFLARFSRRIINTHPALLPLFPGTDGPGLAIAAGVRISGCTVHVVDGGVDSGPILAQAAVPVAPDDTRDSLHERIRRAEHHLLPRVIDAIARNAITLEPTLHLSSNFDDRAQLFSLTDPPAVDPRDDNSP